VSQPGDGGDRPADPPLPKIGTIRNISDLSQDLQVAILDGALLSLGGAGIHDNSVDVGVLSEVLVHFDRLYRIMRAFAARLEVKRTGRLPEVAGAKRLAVLPAYTGKSFAVPLRLEGPEGEMVVEDRNELEAVVSLLAEQEGEQFAARLFDLPERAGDELTLLLETLAAGSVDLSIEVVRGGQSKTPVRVATQEADVRSVWLSEPVASEVGTEALRGKLFRIDTKRGRIATDVSREEDEAPDVVEASFRPDQFDDLRDALNQQVEIEVSVVEERRRYERTARGRTRSIMSIRRLSES
jgi:hypothetical protein